MRITPEKLGTYQRERVIKKYDKLKKHRRGTSFSADDLREVFWPEYLKQGSEFFNISFPMCKYFEDRKSTPEDIKKRRAPFYCRKKKKLLYDDERGRSECTVKRSGWKVSDSLKDGGRDLICGYEPIDGARKPFSLNPRDVRLRNVKASSALHEAVSSLTWRYLYLAQKAAKMISVSPSGITRRAVYKRLKISELEFRKYVEPFLLFNWRRLSPKILSRRRKGPRSCQQQR
jgi:hypothetical protein